MKTAAYILLLLTLGVPLFAQSAIQPEVLLLADGAKINIKAKTPTGFERLGLNWDFKLTTEAGADSGSIPGMKCTAASLDYTAALPELPERTRFILNVALLDKKQNKLAAGSVKFATPPKPLWRDFKEGIPDSTVPAPWEPVELNGKEVTLWGRRFIFGNSPLPEQIFSKGQPLLASPMKVILAPAPAKSTSLL